MSGGGMAVGQVVCLHAVITVPETNGDYARPWPAKGSENVRESGDEQAHCPVQVMPVAKM